jgi:mannose/cellobiose epimerase-like protein (N-acyl-D-glucosamine 2-epimerase family)
VDEAGRLLEFAKRSRVPGGFGWLRADGTTDPERGTPLWIGGRMTHCFALGVLLGHPDSAAYADHGLATLPPRGGEDAYAHAFAILAAASAAIAGRPRGEEALAEACAIAERRFWREDEGAVADDEPYRGANANMHMVEAFLAAYDATGDDVWAQRALRIATRLMDAARAGDWRVPEHFDEHWTPLPEYNADEPRHPFRPYGVTPGHGLEWARLLLHLRAALDDPPDWLEPAARGLADRAWADGWDEERGGFAYTTDHDGRPVVADRFHWVVCEAIATAAVLGDAEREARARDFAERHFIDRARGGWQHELDAENRPSARTWQGRPDVYHALQATLIPGCPCARASRARCASPAGARWAAARRASARGRRRTRARPPPAGARGRPRRRSGTAS